MLTPAPVPALSEKVRAALEVLRGEDHELYAACLRAVAARTSRPLDEDYPLTWDGRDYDGVGESRAA